MKNVALCFLSMCFFSLPVNCSVLLSIVNVIETGSYLQYLNEDVNMLECSVTFENETFDLDLHMVKNAVPISTDSHNLASRMLSLGQGLCGYKFYNVSLNDPEEGVLTVTDDSDKNYGQSFTIKIFELEGPLEMTQEVVLGTTTTITCGRSSQSQDYCNIYNPAGQLVSSSTRCEYMITTVSMVDVGIWRCISAIPQSMTTINYKVELKIKDYRSVHSWITEANNYISMGCKLVNYTTNVKPSYCEIINPNGESFIIRTGSATPRYTTLKTNLTNFVCGVELEKPLLSSENGLWKCRIGDFGTIFTVGNTKKSVSPKRLLVPTLLSKPFTISCQVPYASTYCHISAPNATRYAPEKPFRISLGECSLSVKQAHTSDNGTWSCYFLRENAVVEEIIEIEVLIAEVMGYINIVETQREKSAELSCHTGILPLQYCRFISPIGIAYHLQNGQKTDSVAYSGRGLEYGDCGIKILSVQQEDLGSWTCVVRVGKDYVFSESSGNILLFQDPSIFSDANLGTTLGVSFGVLIVICGFIGFFAYIRWRKRRRRLNDSDEQITFHRSSDERIFNTAASDYNATQESSGIQMQNETTSPSVYRRGKKQKRNKGKNEEREASSSQSGRNDAADFPPYKASLTPSL